MEKWVNFKWESSAITPSDKFRDFFSNLLSITESGGDMEEFFGNVVNQYQITAENEQLKYLEMLGMLAETYVTAFVAGPLFLITIFIVMGMMSPASMSTLNLIVYVLIPLSAIGFSLLLYVISTGSDISLIKKYRVEKKINYYNYVRTRSISPDDKRMMRRLLKSLRWTNIIESRKQPLKIFFQNPMKVLYISLPAALVYSFISVNQHKITIDLIDDVIIIGALITLVPFLFFYRIQLDRIKKIGNSVPGFLKRLAAINDMGMPLSVAIKINIKDKPWRAEY